ncbi:MAG: hypothetical protein E6J20_12205 [Chloroflexi bacterium]|nr:MAG: hypothetical protein E6J20_12205 [Chloroflexota bacterium]
MDEKLRSELRHRFDFDTWKTAPRAVAELSIGGLIEVGSELGRWTVRKMQPLKVPGTRAASQSMWQEDAAADALLRVDLLEASSGTAARELVLELLGEFQSPEIKRVADPRAGELAFSGPGETAILFARANLVAMVRNAGRRVVQVTEFAKTLDTLLGGG